MEKFTPFYCDICRNTIGNPAVNFKFLELSIIWLPRNNRDIKLFEGRSQMLRFWFWHCYLGIDVRDVDYVKSIRAHYPVNSSLKIVGKEMPTFTKVSLEVGLLPLSHLLD